MKESWAKVHALISKYTSNQDKLGRKFSHTWRLLTALSFSSTKTFLLSLSLKLPDNHYVSTQGYPLIKCFNLYSIYSCNLWNFNWAIQLCSSLFIPFQQKCKGKSRPQQLWSIVCDGHHSKEIFLRITYSCH